MNRLRLGGLTWLGALQFFIAEAIAAAAYRGGYSYRFGYISDLGATLCGDVCSPLHKLMNLSFALQGFLIGGGLALGEPGLGRDRLDNAGKLALAVCALGVFVVGAAPEDVAPGWHYAGAAANLAGCNVAALLLGLGRGAARSPERRAGVAAGAIGLAACLALALRFDGGLGVGAVERLAAYPFLIWLIALGGRFARPTDAGALRAW